MFQPVSRFKFMPFIMIQVPFSVQINGLEHGFLIRRIRKMSLEFLERHLAIAVRIHVGKVGVEFPGIRELFRMIFFAMIFPHVLMHFLELTPFVMAQGAILVAVKAIKSLLFGCREYLFKLLEAQAAITIRIHFREMLVKHAVSTLGVMFALVAG